MTHKAAGQARAAAEEWPSPNRFTKATYAYFMNFLVFTFAVQYIPAADSRSTVKNARRVACVAMETRLQGGPRATFSDPAFSFQLATRYRAPVGRRVEWRLFLVDLRPRQRPRVLDPSSMGCRSIGMLPGGRWTPMRTLGLRWRRISQDSMHKGGWLALAY